MRLHLTNWAFLLTLVAPIFLSSKCIAAPPKTETYRWKNVSIVAGGFITGITFHPKQTGLAYARTDIGGAYRWNAKTSTWMPLLDWLTKPDWNLYGIESLAVDPSDPKWLYLACGTYTNEWGGPGAILSSDDQGRTFRRADLPFKLGGNEDGRSMGNRLAVDPNQGKKLYFGTRRQGLWKSGDHGLHWSAVLGFPKTAQNGIGITAIAFDSRSGHVGSATKSIYVGVADKEHNLYRSQDGGETWSQLQGAPSGYFVNKLTISQTGTLFETLSDGPGPNGVTDGRVERLDIDSGTWTDISPVRPNVGQEKGFGYAGLSIEPHLGTTLAVSTSDRWSPGDEVFYSTDSGKTWIGLSKSAHLDPDAAPYMTWGQPTPRFGWWIGAVALDPFQTNRVMYGTGANIWGCDDVLVQNIGETTNWTIRGNGIEETADIDLLSPAAGPHLISALGDIGGFTHANLDRPAPGMSLHPLLSNTDSVASSESGSLIVRVGRPEHDQSPGGYSTDQGSTWKPFANLPTPKSNSGTVAVSCDGQAIIWAPRNGPLARTTDFGVNWQSSNIASNGLQVAADPVKPNQFYALASDLTLYISNDSGSTFQKASSIASSRDHGSLKAVPSMSGHLFLPTSQGLLYSTDEGRTFTRFSDVDSAESVGFGKAKPGATQPTIFVNGKVAGKFGVFRSDDFGLSWIEITDPRHQFGTRGVVIGDPRIYGRVYLGTNGRGVLYGDPSTTKS